MYVYSAKKWLIESTLYYKAREVTLRSSFTSRERKHYFSGQCETNGRAGPRRMSYILQTISQSIVSDWRYSAGAQELAEVYERVNWTTVIWNVGGSSIFRGEDKQPDYFMATNDARLARSPEDELCLKIDKIWTWFEHRWKQLRNYDDNEWDNYKSDKNFVEQSTADRLK